MVFYINHLIRSHYLISLGQEKRDTVDAYILKINTDLMKSFLEWQIFYNVTFLTGGQIRLHETMCSHVVPEVNKNKLLLMTPLV